MVRIPQPEWSTRPVRVIFPAKVCFSAQNLEIREFTADLSVGGIFLPTDKMIPVGCRGTLTFRISQWEEPFTVAGEVVRQVPPGTEEDDQECGLGIRFIDITPSHEKKLDRLVRGICDGSVVQSIRRTIREDGKGLDAEIRRRPTDQKVILALGAQGEEIKALIREGIPEVVLRLLNNPRVGVSDVKLIIRDPRTPAKVLMAIKRNRRFLADEELRFHYVQHQNVVLADAVSMLRTLSLERLKLLERNPGIRPQIRATAREIVRKKTSRAFGV
jgi:uncharacterized protein (TIGR02266 family)